MLSIESIFNTLNFRFKLSEIINLDAVRLLISFTLVCISSESSFLFSVVLPQECNKK